MHTPKPPLRSILDGRLYRGVALALLVLLTNSAFAQQISTSTGLRSNSTRFGESFQSSWSYRKPGLSMQFNGGGGPFGGLPGNPGIATGLQIGGFQGNFSAGQFSSTNSSSFTPMLTTTNGYPGGMFIGTRRPFVIGVAPVVGGFDPAFAPLGAANTPAGRLARGEFQFVNGRVVPANELADLPPAPAAHLSAPLATTTTSPADSLTTADELLQKGDAALAAGKTAVARIYFQLAAARTESSASLTAAERLRDLDVVPSSRESRGR